MIIFFFTGFSKGTLQNKAQEAVTGGTGLITLRIAEWNFSVAAEYICPWGHFVH